MNDNFTYKSYLYMLKKLKTTYDLVGFDDAYKKIKQNEDFFAVVRHDIDLDLDKALILAELEAKLDIKTTYFILLTTDAYNPLSIYNRNIILNIFSLGHEIGLHFNPLVYDNISWGLNQEISIIENLINSNVKAISYHRHGSLSNSFDVDGDFLDVTKPPFFNDKMKYFADSHGEWRFGNPIDSKEFKMGYPLHICFHPIWRSEKQSSILSIIDNFLFIKAYYLEKFVKYDILDMEIK